MRVFRSVRFNIFLGLLITIGAAIGTLVPQVGDAPEKVNAFQQLHPQLYRLYDFFGFFDLYHTWWFMGLLGLMAFDVIVCKLWNKPPDVGMVALPPEVNREEELERHIAKKEAALKLKPFQARFDVPLSVGEAKSRAQMELKGRFHLHEEFDAETGAAFVATRHRLQRWGSYVAHIALVVILAGALVKSLWGFVEMVPVLEGRSRSMQNKPDWDVYVDKFTVNYYKGTFNPSNFASVMRVQKGDKVLGAKTIHVNDPLDIDGVRFYQASWGAGGMFRSVTLKVGKNLIQMPQRTPTRIPGTPFNVTADVMMPNFTATQGQADTASLDLKNPAVRMTFAVGPHKTAPLWLFLNDPSLCLVEDPQGGLARAPSPPFKLAAIDPVLFSGIQVAYDPGFKIVLTGAILWLLGVVALFYLHRRRLWILIEPGEGGSSVTLGGWSSRAGREFEPEFQRLAETLRQALGGAAPAQLFDNPLTEVPQT